MIKKTTQQGNYKILREIIRKQRHVGKDSDTSYIILFGFLYKYLSDNLENYLTNCIGDDFISLEDAYNDPEAYSTLKRKSLDNLGYFITEYDCYIAEVAKSYEFSFEDKLMSIFESKFEFAQFTHIKLYIEDFLSVLQSYRNHKIYSTKDNLIVHDILLSISKLDVFEKDFTYAQVFDIVANSGIIGAEGTPEYIYDILSDLILVSNPNISKIYNPFLDDASTLIKINHDSDVIAFYGKEANQINYFTSLINMLVNGIDFENIMFKWQDAIDEVSFDDLEFDALISKIPNIKYNDFSNRGYKKQNLELFSNKKETKFKEKLFDELEISEYDASDKMLKAIDDLFSEKMAYEYSMDDFYGEYAQLHDDIFLFLINMVNSLNEDGVMAISLSSNFLFKKSQRLMRKFLTHENNYIDAVIRLPEGLSRNSRSQVIIVFKQKKEHDDIIFIDASKNYSTVQSSKTIPGSFRRNLLIDENTKSKILDAFSNRKSIDKFSNVVPISDIVENDFNLSVSRYVDTYEGEFVNLDDLGKEKEEIDKNIQNLNKKINDLMDELNINL